jgi:hypothetical protein
LKVFVLFTFVLQLLFVSLAFAFIQVSRGASWPSE